MTASESDNRYEVRCEEQSQLTLRGIHRYAFSRKWRHLAYGARTHGEIDVLVEVEFC